MLGRRLAQLSDAFKKWDGDGSGSVSKFEFRHAVRALGLTFEHDVIDSGAHLAL